MLMNILTTQLAVEYP